MSKKFKKGGNGLIPNDENYSLLYPNLLLNPNISTQPNIDTTFKEIGLIYKTNSVAKNAILEMKSDLFNVFGSTPNSDNNFFNSPWIMAIQEITNDLKYYHIIL